MLRSFPTRRSSYLDGTCPTSSMDPVAPEQPSSWLSPEARPGTSSGLPCSSSSRGFRASTRPGAIHNRPRRQAAHQRYKQQHIHGCEPPAGEHVEQLELVEELPQPAVVRDVLIDVSLVEAALRQECPRYRRHRQQK